MSLSSALVKYLRYAVVEARGDDSSRKDAYVGEIILANLLDGLEQKLFGNDFAEDLIQCWMREYGRLKRTPPSLFKPPTPSQMLADSFDAACGMPPPRLKSPHCQWGFRICCKRPLVPECDTDMVEGNYTSITDAWDFVSNRMDDTEKSRQNGKAWIVTILNPVDVNWAKWHPPAKTSIKLKNKPMGKMVSTIGNPAKVLWITPENYTLNARAGVYPAVKLRDRLGLVHHFQNQLLAMTLPATTIHSLAHGRPTVADAGSHRRHMARGAQHAVPNPDPWGKTADLSRITPSDFDFDGLLERIVQPIPVSTLPVVEVQALGSCGSQRGITPHQDDNLVFAGHLCHRHGGIDAVINKLERMLA